jgi:hypothetical protein
MDVGGPTSSRRIVGADGSGCTMPGSAHPAARGHSARPCAPRGRYVGAPSVPGCGWLKQLPKAELCGRLLADLTESRAPIINTATQYSIADIIASAGGLISNWMSGMYILLQMLGRADNPTCLQHSATGPITLSG